MAGGGGAERGPDAQASHTTITWRAAGTSSASAAATTTSLLQQSETKRYSTAIDKSFEEDLQLAVGSSMLSGIVGDDSAYADAARGGRTTHPAANINPVGGRTDASHTHNYSALSFGGGGERGSAGDDTDRDILFAAARAAAGTGNTVAAHAAEAVGERGDAAEANPPGPSNRRRSTITLTLNDTLASTASGGADGAGGGATANAVAPVPYGAHDHQEDHTCGAGSPAATAIQRGTAGEVAASPASAVPPPVITAGALAHSPSPLRVGVGGVGLGVGGAEPGAAAGAVVPAGFAAAAATTTTRTATIPPPSMPLFTEGGARGTTSTTAAAATQHTGTTIMRPTAAATGLALSPIAGRGAGIGGVGGMSGIPSSIDPVSMSASASASVPWLASMSIASATAAAKGGGGGAAATSYAGGVGVGVSGPPASVDADGIKRQLQDAYERRETQLRARLALDKQKLELDARVAQDALGVEQAKRAELTGEVVRLKEALREAEVASRSSEDTRIQNLREQHRVEVQQLSQELNEARLRRARGDDGTAAPTDPAAAAATATLRAKVKSQESAIATASSALRAQTEYIAELDARVAELTQELEGARRRRRGGGEAGEATGGGNGGAANTAALLAQQQSDAERIGVLEARVLSLTSQLDRRSSEVQAVTDQKDSEIEQLERMLKQESARVAHAIRDHMTAMKDLETTRDSEVAELKKVIEDLLIQQKRREQLTDNLRDQLQAKEDTIAHLKANARALETSRVVESPSRGGTGVPIGTVCDACTATTTLLHDLQQQLAVKEKIIVQLRSDLTTARAASVHLSGVEALAAANYTGAGGVRGGFEGSNGNSNDHVNTTSRSTTPPPPPQPQPQPPLAFVDVNVLAGLRGGALPGGTDPQGRSVGSPRSPQQNRAAMEPHQTTHATPHRTESSASLARYASELKHFGQFASIDACGRAPTCDALPPTISMPHDAVVRIQQLECALHEKEASHAELQNGLRDVIGQLEVRLTTDARARSEERQCWSGRVENLEATLRTLVSSVQAHACDTPLSMVVGDIAKDALGGASEGVSGSSPGGRYHAPTTTTTTTTTATVVAAGTAAEGAPEGDRSGTHLPTSPTPTPEGAAPVPVPRDPAVQEGGVRAAAGVVREGGGVSTTAAATATAPPDDADLEEAMRTVSAALDRSTVGSGVYPSAATAAGGGAPSADSSTVHYHPLGKVPRTSSAAAANAVVTSPSCGAGFSRLREALAGGGGGEVEEAGSTAGGGALVDADADADARRAITRTATPPSQVSGSLERAQGSVVGGGKGAAAAPASAPPYGASLNTSRITHHPEDAAGDADSVPNHATGRTLDQDILQRIETHLQRMVEGVGAGAGVGEGRTPSEGTRLKQELSEKRNALHTLHKKYKAAKAQLAAQTRQNSEMTRELSQLSVLVETSAAPQGALPSTGGRARGRDAAVAKTVGGGTSRRRSVSGGKRQSTPAAPARSASNGVVQRPPVIAASSGRLSWMHAASRR